MDECYFFVDPGEQTSAWVSINWNLRLFSDITSENQTIQLKQHEAGSLTPHRCTWSHIWDVSLTCVWPSSRCLTASLNAFIDHPRYSLFAPDISRNWIHMRRKATGRERRRGIRYSSHTLLKKRDRTWENGDALWIYSLISEYYSIYYVAGCGECSHY